ncbi:PfkB family carbohydrate kinase [Shewanella sp. A3A]|nr:PfkB family carbohydrate kinase [Shewanella ferrihydritica]
MNECLPIYIFGEVLFDCFPDSEPMLGGAPFNVAWHLQAFGANPRLISAVGADDGGQQILAKMQQWGMDTQSVIVDAQHETGRVDVTFADGEPQYDIVLDAAYDHIDQRSLPVPSGEHLLYHGTLAARCTTSRESLGQLRTWPGQKAFIDVNLRDPWWELDWVRSEVHGGHCVKLNRQELILLSAAEHEPADQEALKVLARNFRLANNIANLIVTQGADGAFLVDEMGDIISHSLPPQARTVVDTVGAGDAFSAIVILGMLNNWQWETVLERAQQFAGFIVTQQGAVSDNPAIYGDFKCLWGMR